MTKFCTTLLVYLFLYQFAPCQTSLRLDSGTQYIIKNRLENKATTEAMGQSVEISSLVEYDNATKVARVTDTALFLESNITFVSGFVDYNGQKSAFDSKTGKMDGPIAEAYGKVINKPFTRRYDARGQFIKLTFSDQQHKPPSSALREAGISREDPQLFNEQFLEHKLDEAGSWTDTLNITGKMNTKVITRYTVTASNGEIAAINYTSTETYDGVIERMGMEVSTNGKKNTTGVYRVNRKTGVIESHNYEGDVESVIEYFGNESPTNAHFTGTVTITRQ